MLEQHFQVIFLGSRIATFPFNLNAIQYYTHLQIEPRMPQQYVHVQHIVGAPPTGIRTLYALFQRTAQVSSQNILGSSIEHVLLSNRGFEVSR